MKTVYLGIDVEPDCPPYLDTHFGITEGMPKLLALLATEQVKATFFVTGNVAQAYPELMRQIVMAGHELGCHGLTHRRFSEMSTAEAEFEIKTASAILRQYSDQVIAFRAPCLDFPESLLPLLTQYGFTIDSSTARFRGTKQQHPKKTNGLLSIPASISSGTFRAAPRWFTYLRIRHINPLVLYFHPWEFVDMSATKIPFGCRTKTGTPAVTNLQRWIQLLKRKGYQFVMMKDIPYLKI